MTKNKFYVTNAIPYVNAKPHIGHALEFVQSDTIGRYHKFILKENAILSCGTDVNALKNVQAAEKEGVPVKEFVERNSRIFFDLWEKLGTKFDYITAGNDPRHIKSSQELWKLCKKSGDIDKKLYKGLYCIGCEAFYTESELDEKGECYEHPGKKLEEVEEINYFFKLNKYRERLIRIIKGNDKDFFIDIVPTSRKNEVLSFLDKDLEDLSISRTNERAKNWGVPVPGDPTQRIYVWFDALNIYQTAVGFVWNKDLYNELWPADLHVIGKGIIKFHTVYWPAFLLSAGLKLPKKIFVHDYITVNNQKMSKTLGNILDPFPLIDKYGEGLRYYLLAKISPFSESDFSEEKLREVYNADLANGLGNLISRVAKLCELIPQNYTIKSLSNVFNDNRLNIAFEDYEKKYKDSIERFSFHEALGALWQEIFRLLDTEIQDIKPWEYGTSSDDRKIEIKAKLLGWVVAIKNIAYYLKPFLPKTAEKIEEQFKGPKIYSKSPLFPRI